MDTATNYFGQPIRRGDIVAYVAQKNRSTVTRLGVVQRVADSGVTAHVHWVFGRYGVHGDREYWVTEKSNARAVKLIRPLLDGMEAELVAALDAKRREIISD